ncbi:ABC transporter substrate-binding protein [Curvibacter sp. HBC28]|uniref:ABC transporter substrate-binding protein n=1 Tax=Curvibacter microcysteis TaxID=3026419 RepID=A0ABT5MHE3_9BURK|nr:ABC transporter substrate-binding protein [Curvibacter sp. HBC28]MDD0814605.1 ABC transporter substrate-binding protein [Curvibacter sp. HBC28]
MDRRNFVKLGGAATAAQFLPTLALAQQGSVFRIGALNPITGAGSPYGPGMQQAIRLAVEEVNAAGGAGGYKLELFSEDTQTKPDAAVLAAKKLIEVNKVQAVLGTWSSGVTLAVMPLTDAADLIEMNVSGAPAISTLDKKDLVWRFQATNDRFGAAFSEICAKRGFKRPATMAFNNASGLGNVQGFAKAWKKRGGEVVAEVVYEPNRPSYRSELQSILNAKPDVIVTGSYLPDTTIILREWWQAGVDVKWVIPGWAANPDLVKALGNEVCEGIISVDTVSNEKSESYAHFDAAFTKATGKPAASNVYAAMAYDMVISLALAMEAAGKGATVAQINSKIRDVSNAPGTAVFTFAKGKELLGKKQKVNYEGASSKLDFDAAGDATPDFGVFIIEKGQLVRRDVVSIPASL